MAFLNQSNLNLRATKNIQSKIDESETAQALIDRMSSIIRDPELGALRYDAEGMPRDANHVADYVDNAMRDADVKEFEEYCIKSNMLLGEVALCHEALAQLFRDDQPAVSTELREKIYAMGHVPLNLADSSETTRIEYLGGAQVRTRDDREGAEEERLSDSKELDFKLSPPPEETSERHDEWASSWSDHDLGELQDRNRTLARLRTIVGVGGAFALLIATLVFVFSERRKDAISKSKEASEPAKSTLDADAASKRPDESEAPDSRFAVDPALKREDMVAMTRQQAIERRGEENTESNSPDADASSSKTVEVDWPETAPVQPISAQLASPRELALIVSPEDGIARQWMDGAAYPSGHAIQTLPGFRPRIDVDSQFAVTVLERSSIAFGRTEKGTAEIDIRYGRVLVQSLGDPTATIGLRINGTPYSFQMRSPDTHVAIEVLHSLDSTVETKVRYDGWQVFCQQGSCLIGTQPEQALLSGQCLLVRNAESDLIVGTAVQPPPFLEGAPRAKNDPVSSLFEELGADADLEKELRSQLESKRADVRLAAARSLISLNFFDVLVRLLDDENHRANWTKLIDDAIDQLAKNDSIVAQLQTWLEDKSADEKLVFELLLGYTDEQLEGGKDAALVQALESETLAIRVLAIERLRRITGFTLLYRPEVEAQNRAPKVERWKQFLNQNAIRWDRPIRARFWEVEPGVEQADPEGAKKGAETADPAGADSE